MWVGNLDCTVLAIHCDRGNLLMSKSTIFLGSESGAPVKLAPSLRLAG